MHVKFFELYHPKVFYEMGPKFLQIKVLNLKKISWNKVIRGNLISCCRKLFDGFFVKSLRLAPNSFDKKLSLPPRHRGLGGKYSLSIYLDEEGLGFKPRRSLYRIRFLLQRLHRLKGDFKRETGNARLSKRNDNNDWKEARGCSNQSSSNGGAI